MFYLVHTTQVYRYTSMLVLVFVVMLNNIPHCRKIEVESLTDLNGPVLRSTGESTLVGDSVTKLSGAAKNTSCILRSI